MNKPFMPYSASSNIKCAYINKTLLLIIVITIVFGIPFTSLLAQPTKQWDKTIGGNSSDELRSVQQTTDGGFILGGISQSLASGDKSEDSGFSYYGDYWIVKLNAAGGKEWDNTLGGVGTNDFTAVYQAADGGYIVGGHSLSNAGRDKTQDSKGINDYWIIKLDASGNKIWDKTIGGPWDDLLWTLKPTKDGGVILGGESQGGPGGDKTQAPKGGYDFWVVKLDAQGNKQWDKTIGGSGYDILRSIDLTSDGGYILGGLSASEASGDKSENSKGAGSSDPLAGYDYWVVKLNASGTKEWDKTIGGNALDDFRSLIQTKDGGYILAGESYSNISGDKSENSKGGRDYWVVKLNASGVKEWDKTYGGTRDEYVHNIHHTIDGGSALVGTLNSLIKLNSGGNIEWEKAINGGGSFKSLDQTADDGYILGTFSSSNAFGDKSEDSKGGYDYWVVKLSADRTISTTLLNNPGYCTESELAVSFTTKGTFSSGEVYKAQLSDATGSFASPVTIGTGIKSPIMASIPFKTRPGTGYKIRVVSSLEPIVIGSDNGFSFAISSTMLGQTFYIMGPMEPCAQTQASYVISNLDDYHNFNWSVPTGWAIVSGQGTSSIIVSVGNTAGTVSVTGENYCEMEIRGDVAITPTVVPAQPDVITASAPSVCNGDTIVYSTNLVNQNYTIKTRYNWMVPSGWIILQGQGTNSIMVKASSESGPISVSALNQCGTSPYRILNVINSSPLPPTVISASRCGPGSVTLTASGGYSNGYYRWYTSSSGGTAIPNATASTFTTPFLATTTTYYVSTVKDFCESKRIPVTATIHPVPVILAKASSFTIPVGGATTLSATGANTYVWSGTNFGGSTNATITVSPPVTTTYQVTGTNAYGCSSTASVTITVKQNQVITFPPLANKVYGDAPFPLNATSSSGLPVSYSILAGPATVSGNIITLTGVGTVTVRAMQTGNSAYLAATPVDQSFIVSPALTCTATGTILREQWNNITGTSVSVIPVTTTPSSTSQLTSFEAPSNIGSSYGARIRGYICAPQTGAYTFWIAGDNDCELWLSTDENPANKVKIAGLVGYTGVRQWSVYSSQKSILINLVANKRYYVEALHKENSNGDNVAVGWKTPGSTTITVIPGTVLSPVTNVTSNTAPTVRITSPSTGGTFTAPATINITANATDADGTIAKVEFFRGTTKLGEDFTSPYAYSWTGVAAGTYSLTAKATDNLGLSTISAPVSIPVQAATTTCVATGTILREQWNNITGTSVSVIPVNTLPSSTSQLTLFEAPSNIGTSYGSRIRGYICAPQTGAYTFWIAGDNDCELWLSPDENPINKVKIAGLVGYTAVRQWNKYASQKSVLINLEANKRYYVEVLHKENSNGDNVAVAWQLPSGLMEAPIAGARLSPYLVTSTQQLASVVKSNPEATPIKAKATFLKAYPNPFSKVATIQFSLAAPEMVTLQVLNLNGRLLQTLHRGAVEKDRLYSFELTGDSFASGVYLCCLVYGDHSRYERLVLIK